MSAALLTDLTIFILALLVGIEVIGKVPATLHTPLMSATNAIHGIVLVGALLIGVTAHNAVGYVLAFVASFFAGANVVGGYVVTGRMLKKFRRKTPEVQERPEPELESLNGHKGLRGLAGRIGVGRAPSRGAPPQGAPSQGAPSQGAPSQGAPSQGAPSQGAGQ